MVTKFVRFGADNCGRENIGVGWEKPTIGDVVVVYCSAGCVKPGGKRGEDLGVGVNVADVVGAPKRENDTVGCGLV